MKTVVQATVFFIKTYLCPSNFLCEKTPFDFSFYRFYFFCQKPNHCTDKKNIRHHPKPYWLCKICTEEKIFYRYGNSGKHKTIYGKG